jgi:hypothetical protein
LHCKVYLGKSKIDGALVAMRATATINRRLPRDFAREWAEGLRVKHKAPPGEDEIARLRRTDQ